MRSSRCMAVFAGPATVRMQSVVGPRGRVGPRAREPFAPGLSRARSHPARLRGAAAPEDRHAASRIVVLSFLVSLVIVVAS